jgi:nitroimidazol reductase NimA-like FMN-containing flavoprotein (pyridoxamine 5'-phosphate oxidase superfamily)
MIGELTNAQIDQVLASQMIGRIGCHVEGRTYIVPVAFAFDGHHVYAHSRSGLKISMMRKNPKVCFEVDIIENMGNWRSVILQGEYEELKTGELQLLAFKLLSDRLSPLQTSQAARPSPRTPPGEKKMRPVFFRISIIEKSGRYEKD